MLEDIKIIGQIANEDTHFVFEVARDSVNPNIAEIIIVNYGFDKLNNKEIYDIGVATLSRADIEALRDVLNNILA